MLNTKALLLSGGGSTFTIRITTADENGFSGTFSGTLSYGKVVSVSGSTSSPFVEEVDTLDYVGVIRLSSVKTSYPIYRYIYSSPYRTTEFLTGPVTVSDPELTDGDEVNITIKTNSSA